MNKIDEFRKEMLEYSNSDSEIIDSEIIFSPNGKYKIETYSYKLNKPNSDLEASKVQIFETPDNSLIFSFLVSNGFFFIAG